MNPRYETKIKRINQWRDGQVDSISLLDLEIKILRFIEYLKKECQKKEMYASINQMN